MKSSTALLALAIFVATASTAPAPVDLDSNVESLLQQLPGGQVQSVDYYLPISQLGETVSLFPSITILRMLIIIDSIGMSHSPPWTTDPLLLSTAMVYWSH